MKNNDTKSNHTNNVSEKNQTSSSDCGNKASNKTNHMKANPDKRERRDGPGGE